MGGFGTYCIRLMIHFAFNNSLGAPNKSIRIIIYFDNVCLVSLKTCYSPSFEAQYVIDHHLKHLSALIRQKRASRHIFL